MGSEHFSDVSLHQPRRSQRRWKFPAYVLPAIIFLLYVQMFILPRYFSEPLPSALKLSSFRLDQLNAGLERCAQIHKPKIQHSVPPSSFRLNPRWNPLNGQNVSIVLRNATLFDGETVLYEAVDILFSKGIIKDVSPVSEDSFSSMKNVEVLQLDGQFVTPGLVDMHSHHMLDAWPASASLSDGNEKHLESGPLTPFVRSIDGLKPYDLATAIIASGGITTSLIIPGSANIMGGEGYLVKNVNKPGPDGEEVIEDMLLDHGIAQSDRQRYLKMACGENPKRVYSHTRMGNAWILRKQLARAQELREEQDSWCLEAAAAKEIGDESKIAALVKQSNDKAGLAAQLELDSTVAMLRGKININIHCYEPEDMEDMIRHSEEFGFRISAFHHALSAWKVPEMLKKSGQNITIATFANFGLYKQEGYRVSLWAGKILSDHGIPVAYKSDHVEEELNAKYLMYQAAGAHSFQLPEHLALQSVTSVPAKSLEIDHRVGYARPGYDADIVIWNSHPLSVGATPLQVYIDGKPTLDPKKVAESLSKVKTKGASKAVKPQQKANPTPEIKAQFCETVQSQGKDVVITGIKKSFLGSATTSITGNLSMVIRDGKLVCFGDQQQCISKNNPEDTNVITLENGHVLPGLTFLSGNLGIAEIFTLDDTGDGVLSTHTDPKDQDSVVYAKYGIHLEGKAFNRARIGGVTRAVTPPLAMAGGMAGGVSVGIKTSQKKTVLDGGIFKDNVALHFNLGQDVKASDSTPTISTAIAKLRKILAENTTSDSIYGEAANGTIPIVVHVDNKYEIMQLIKIKEDFPSINLVVYGGHGAAAIAAALANASIPVILAPVRGAPEQWQKLDALVGPPLTKSAAQVLSEAGVTFAIAFGALADASIHTLLAEASWAAKYAGLGEAAAVNLVSRNVEAILGLGVDEETRDFVVYEGDPLEGAGSVVFSVEWDEDLGANGRKGVMSVVDCWPEAE